MGLHILTSPDCSPDMDDRFWFTIMGFYWFCGSILVLHLCGVPGFV